MTDFPDSVDEAITLDDTISEVGGAFLVSVTETISLADTVAETLGEVCVIAEAMTLADATDGNWTREHRNLSPSPRRRFGRSQQHNPI